MRGLTPTEVWLLEDACIVLDEATLAEDVDPSEWLTPEQETAAYRLEKRGLLVINEYGFLDITSLGRTALACQRALDVKA